MGPKIEQILSIEPIGKIILDEKEGKPINVYSNGIKLFLAATDKTVDRDKIYYTLNDKPEAEYRKPIRISTRGILTYSIKAMDKLGNFTESEVVEIFIKWHVLCTHKKSPPRKSGRAF